MKPPKKVEQRKKVFAIGNCTDTDVELTPEIAKADEIWIYEKNFNLEYDDLLALCRRNDIPIKYKTPKYSAIRNYCNTKNHPKIFDKSKERER